MEQISNEALTITVSAKGAELQSIIDADGKEYMWQGQPGMWSKHSPILFPIVGTVHDNSYQVGFDRYNMSRHGFARDMEFKLIAQGEQQLIYALHETEETLKQYPYRFNLSVSYKIRQNRLHIVWHVENTDTKPIYFQIGGHPAFNLPDLLPGEPVKGRLQLDTDNPLRLFLDADGFVKKGKYEEAHTQDGIWEFDEDTFKEDAVIFDHSQIKRVSLINGRGEAEVTVTMKTPALGIWNPYGQHAPFVCIEPWYGITDAEGEQGDFRDKYLMNQLLPGASFMSEYIITIGDTE